MKKIMNEIVGLVLPIMVAMGIATFVEAVCPFSNNYVKDGKYDITNMMEEGQIVSAYSLINGQICTAYTGFIVSDQGIIVTNTHGFISDEQHFSTHSYQEMKDTINNNVLVNNSLVRVLSYIIG